MALGAGCGDDGGSGGDDPTLGTTTLGSTATSSPTSASEATSQGSGTETEGPKFDVGEETESTTGPIDMCKVVDDMDAVGDCEDVAPPDSFEADIQWEWWGPNPNDRSIVTPLVVNLTDDNDDGEIDPAMFPTSSS